MLQAESRRKGRRRRAVRHRSGGEVWLWYHIKKHEIDWIGVPSRGAQASLIYWPRLGIQDYIDLI
jgi:hypothetical protein